MFPAVPAQINKQERKLLKLFKLLNGKDKDSVLAFGEFLLSRDEDNITGTGKTQTVASEPVDIPRPEEESVIKAIKRLSATYPMVDNETILHPISNLMTSHMISGRSAPDVIDDLQDLFFNEYKSLKDE